MVPKYNSEEISALREQELFVGREDPVNFLEDPEKESRNRGFSLDLMGGPLRYSREGRRERRAR